MRSAMTLNSSVRSLIEVLAPGLMVLSFHADTGLVVPNRPLCVQVMCVQVDVHEGQAGACGCVRLVERAST